MSSTTPAAKRQRQEKLIGTHSGTFHADEALAVHLVRTLPDFKGAALVRTRDPAKLDECDIVVDVGGVYDDAAKRYDHHQRGFEETFDAQHKTKLSSAGLIYKHYGKQIIGQAIQSDDEEKLEILYQKLYDNFVEALDGIDNGIQQYESDKPARYSSRTDLSSRVAQLNPGWNQPSSNDILDQKFEVASSLAGGEFFAALDRAANSWYPAKTLVLTGFNARKQYDPSGQLIVFEEFAPWKEHLFNIEAEQKVPENEKPLYIVYADEAGKWRIQAVPLTPDSFQSRKALPEAWRGIRDQALSDLTGIPGGIFVHAAGFIGGNETKEGAIAMAKKALEM